jgi:hypothetical protein
VIKKKTQKKTQKMASASYTTPANAAALEAGLVVWKRFEALCNDEWQFAYGNFPSILTIYTRPVFDEDWHLRADVDFLGAWTEDELRDLARDWVAQLRRVEKMVSESPGRVFVFTCKECEGISGVSAAAIMRHVLDEHPYCPAVKAAGKE